MNSPEWIRPQWPAPECVGSLITTRNGGVSRGCYSSLNLGDHVGDDPAAVATNRERVIEITGSQPSWLTQIHGTNVVDADECSSAGPSLQADAAFSRRAGVACAVMTADCLPVLFCDDDGTVVAAAHAGWRGLLAGVLENTVKAMGVPGNRLMAYLGPAIGPQAFEVGEEVLTAFVSLNPEAATAFQPSVQGKWLADIYLLARQRLLQKGIDRVFGGVFCTVNEPERFFSYRRDGQTGRMASLIWLNKA